MVAAGASVAESVYGFYMRARTHCFHWIFSVIFRPENPIELERLGTKYGGWWIPPSLIDSSSICYLAGVGTDISFDKALVERFGCSAWGIDPTPRAILWMSEQVLPISYTFVPLGLAGETGELRFYSPRNSEHVSHSTKNLQRTKGFFTAEVTTVNELMQRLGHAHLDLLKLDIEGAEHDTIRTMLSNGVYPQVLCVEFDQPEPLKWARQTTSALRKKGYDLVKVDGFNLTFVRDGKR